MIGLHCNFCDRKHKMILFSTMREAYRWVYEALVEAGEIEDSEENDVDFDTVVVEYAETLPTNEFLTFLPVEDLRKARDYEPR